MVAEVHVAAAPLQESHRHPEGLRHPIYITLTRQVRFPNLMSACLLLGTRVCICSGFPGVQL